MPVELNGTYWTIQEIAEAVGLEYSGVSRRIMKDGYANRLITLGKTYIVPDDLAQELMGVLDGRTQSAGYITKVLGIPMSILQDIASVGFPHIEKGDTLAFYPEHTGILQAAYNKVVHSGKYEEANYGIMTAKLTLQILKQLEDGDVADN